MKDQSADTPLTAALERVAADYALPGSYGRCIAFMLDGIGLVEGLLPRMARDALAVATRYWVGGDRSASLEEEKCAVWTHLDRGNRDGGLDETTESRLRVVLFVLDTSPSTDDMFELLDWFVQFLSGAGANGEDVIGLLGAHFPKRAASAG